MNKFCLKVTVVQTILFTCKYIRCLSALCLQSTMGCSGVIVFHTQSKFFPNLTISLRENQSAPKITALWQVTCLNFLTLWSVRVIYGERQYDSEQCGFDHSDLEDHLCIRIKNKHTKTIAFNWFFYYTKQFRGFWG